MSLKNSFRLTSQLSAIDQTDEALKHYYQSWRTLNQHSNSPFIALDNSFRDKYLKDLESGPLKLYLYFCFAARNDYGNSWHSIPTIADFFGTQTRTIDNWIKVLVDKDLVYRAQKGKKSHTTYLLPFSDTVVMHSATKKHVDDNQELVDDLIKKIKNLEVVYGEIIKVCHLFQWSLQKGKTISKANSLQDLLIITKRNNDVLIGHIYTFRKSDHLSINQLDIEEPAIFRSPFYFNNSNIVGLALPSTPAIRSKAALKELLALIKELAEIEDWELEDRQKLVYGNKDELLPNTEENKEEADNEETIEDE